MYLIYIDESGDTGFVKGSSDYYILAGISFEDTYWKEIFWKILELQKEITQKFGIKGFELKGFDLFSHRGSFFNTSLTPPDLNWIYNKTFSLICDPLIQIFVIAESKREFRTKKFKIENLKNSKEENLKKPFLRHIWRKFIFSYERYLLEKTIKDGNPKTALVFYDDNPGLTKHVREIIKEFSRKFDTSLKFPAAGLIEDLISKDSKSSYFIQLADLLAYSVNRIKNQQESSRFIKINEEIKNKLNDRLKRIENFYNKERLF